MDQKREYQMMARECRKKRMEALAEGHHSQAQEFDAAERDCYAAINQIDGVPEEIVGTKGRTL